MEGTFLGFFGLFVFFLLFIIRKLHNENSVTNPIYLYLDLMVVNV